MIDEILKTVDEKIGSNLASETGVSRDSIPEALSVISDTVMGKAKSYIDNNQILKLKDAFLSSDEETKEGFMTEIKNEVIEALSTKMNLGTDISSKLTELSVPEIIQVSKEKLLGPNGKVTFMDYPKLFSFFKSGGKEVKSGGLSGLFG